MPVRTIEIEPINIASRRGFHRRRHFPVTAGCRQYDWPVETVLLRDVDMALCATNDYSLASQAMFIPRMWNDEVERIGKQRCTPFGYALQGIGELVGFLGLLTLLGMPVYLAYRGVVGDFQWPLLWLMAIPVVMGMTGWAIVAVSWWLAFRKKYQYNEERRESTWIEAGESRSYTFEDWESEKCHRVG